ncbi:MAG: transglutaminase-like domain-containing protein [Thermodesulfobacteriota bacterium]|nr:transglutaminase-like domain-containing protein [Thermodesulfobacteriota bacterium]
MSLNKMKSYWMAGAFFALVFSVLLIMRMDLLDKIFSAPQALPISSPSVLPSSDTWMNIFQKDKKIGFSHKIFTKKENGYLLQENVFMRINTMGMVQNINLKTHGVLNDDLSLSSFDFKISSGRFNFSANGSVSGDVIHITTQSSGSFKTYNIQLKNKPYIAAGIMDAIRIAGIKTGEKYTFDVFDPATMGQEPVLVTVVGKENVEAMGSMKAATKFLMNFKGATQFAWIGEDGEVLKEKGLLGINLEKTTRNDALDKLSVETGEDLTKLASIASNMMIKDASGLQKLKLEISGIKYNEVNLQGERQTLTNNILTVKKESLLGLPPALEVDKLEPLEKIFMQPEPFIQSDHRTIIDQAKKIIQDEIVPLNKAKKLIEWVYKNIEKRPVLSVPDALSTLENRVGDCNEHAVLLAALARASGIPARIETGLAYLNGRFYYHAWNLLYLGRWITADSAFGQIPADVTHIRFTTGSLKQLDLMGIIGQIKLKVIG